MAKNTSLTVEAMKPLKMEWKRVAQRASATRAKRIRLEMRRTPRSNIGRWRGGEYLDPTIEHIMLLMGELRQAGMIMIAETISLGILSLPSVLAAIGIAP